MDDLAKTIQQAQKGEPDAVNRLIDRYSNFIFQECERFGLWGMADWSHADLHQEVLLRLFTKLDRFDVEADSKNIELRFEAWIRTTLQNHIKNIIRNQNAKKRRPSDGIVIFCEKTQAYLANNYISRTASSIFVEDEEHEKLNAFIAERLDEHSRTILDMRIFEGATIQGIADQMGLTFEQVRYNLAKTQDFIKKYLEGHPL